MQVNKKPMSEFLEGRSKTFVIPVYQRDYAWQKENCEKLWNDLLDIQTTKKNTHFLGTIVNIYDRQEERLIIDGQQRLTTVSLLLLALVNFLKNKVDKTEEELNIQEDILDFYLTNKRSSSENNKIRLKPNKQDRSYFEELFKNPKDLKNDSNIVNNYNFFYSKIISLEIQPVELFELFKKLQIVDIELEREFDDPQLIFESLNSTGVDLTDGDLIRNYILMDLEASFQEKLYLDYWLKIENSTADVAEFIRNFLMFKLNRNVTQTKRAVYSEFKKYAEEKYKKNSQKVLKEILKYAQVYSCFIRQNIHSSKLIDYSLDRLFRLEFKVAYPFLFEIFDLLEQQILSEQNVVEITKLIESYAFRKILVDNTTQGLNKFFLTLDKEIKKLEPENWQNQYLEILKFIIKNKTASQKFPTDENFVETLMEKEIYKLKTKNKDFLLEGLENYNSSYKVDLEDLTVEHILPQNATKWKQNLGSNWQEIRNKYIHTLGNLTLTAQNSKLSNKDFQSKQDIDFHTSKLKLSYKLSEKENWNEQTILERSKKLALEAAKIWTYPQTDYQKPIEEKETYSFDEETDFSGKKPKALYFAEKTFAIKYWRDILKIVCEELYKYSPTEFNLLIQNSELKKYFAVAENSNLRSPVSFNNNKYVDGNQSANSIVSFVIKLCSLVNYDYSNLQIETI
jgi:uncharacterized protein with ParB-like and HNH nuclease domain